LCGSWKGAMIQGKSGSIALTFPFRVQFVAV
jgi:hypothetical protein